MTVMKKILCLLCLVGVTAMAVGCGESGDGMKDSPDTADYTGTGKTESAYGGQENEIVDSRTEITEGEAGSVEKFDLAAGTNGNAPTVMLNSGYKMPVAGIGTYSLTGQTCIDSIKSALKQGVRLIDTAYMYGNDVICCEL